MQLLSINSGQPETITIGQRVATTGIFKTPIAGQVHVSTQGLVGDTIADTVHHGGADQAVYLYSAEDYAWWEAELQHSIPFGTFGENLTLSSFGPQPLRAGDRILISTVLLEVTFPRIPCATLAARMNDATFVQQFTQARRPGAYARVLSPGDLQVNEPVTVEYASPSFPTLTELADLWHAKERHPDLLDEALKAPIAERFKAIFQQRLERSLTSSDSATQED
ncbi:MAG: MOSC domain-containing protein [Tildeniella torsiva UHER 1998/13D]|jgi:MOSC domain-containing protein YiiM|nr:MOSC domain-containing protein [Tildeniella torsiva UHER 1998/13D]